MQKQMIDIRYRVQGKDPSFSFRLPSVVHGLTLLEMLVTLAIFTIIMATIVSSVLLFYRSNSSAIEQAYQVESARKGVDLLVRDIREVSYADNGAYPLAAIATSSIIFYADTDRDESVEMITYKLSGASFLRTVVDSSGNPSVYTSTGTTTVVSRYVQNNPQDVVIFQYLNASSTPISSMSEIVNVRSIVINLIVNVNPTRAPGEFTLRSSATLRNLRAQ
ncbi:hypothetical protein A2841_03980 [Candidatus Kaiserbacteria bacterium RIFCSPHIGHO2_01_FULL_48_10]|uniref:Type II secretion system protein J n=1 Tax=Candidatus Kaiserbacteria bacterium RIFCSPHIGHO2_01_FULL_48_10 TaxID=1798476 RepID=A0A1F6C4T1_9BACT|nr:MAG: hypothetical protein A2841_03980 [Candidatus Kaiserbacteria bacterium RIFCSPHIGHO2_01_FULL_48_10]